MQTVNFRDAINEIINQELHRQHEKWGNQSHSPETWIVILSEELGEVSQATLQKDTLALIGELAQVAAVAISAMDDLLHPDNKYTKGE